MSESLGGSRRGGGGNAGAAALGMTRGSSMGSSTRGNGGGGGGYGGGGIMAGMAQTARPGGTYHSPSPGGMGGSARPPRPASAPRERGGKFSYSANAGGGFGSPADAKARVEESRQVKEAGYWGRTPPMKRDLPAFWSVSTYGIPFNDERLAMGGAVNLYQILEPQKSSQAGHDHSGPVAEQHEMLRKSLKDDRLYFDPATLKPLSQPKDLEPRHRLFILNNLTPYQRIHALRLCLDQDQQQPGWQPWVETVGLAVENKGLNLKFWIRDQDCAIRTATTILENMIRRHVHFLSEQRCVLARAPASSIKGLLREAFWKVDPERTGLVSMEQFMQVWQNQMSLLLYKDEIARLPNGKKKLILKPTSKFIIDENMTAAIFCKYGFDKDGLMPYAVFNQAISSKPARLLGQELLVDKAATGHKGLSEDKDVGYCLGGAKIIYKVKCDMGVVPPSHFEEEVAARSQKAPSAHMWLEHVYGYAGVGVNSSNLYFTHNTTETLTEVVYYTGAVGVVFNKEKWEQKQPSQRFFFGHDNDIMCLALHPNRRFVATGQQKNTGPNALPYVCIWDVDTCNMLQKLDHDRSERSVIAVCFSGNINAALTDNDKNRPAEEQSALLSQKQGGSLIVTITADDKHTVHVWQWMKPENKYCRARNIPGWCIGPSYKIEELTHKGMHFHNTVTDEKTGKIKDWCKTREDYDAEFKDQDGDELSATAKKMDHPLLNYLLPLSGRTPDKHPMICQDWEEGKCVAMPPGANPKNGDKSVEMFELGPGCNGTPPMVYGIVWNPLRPSDGRKGSEFATYGVKHLKVWAVGDEVDTNSGHGWRGTSASFGVGLGEVENVLSACFVPARHYMAAPSDTCLLTGFASGQIGIWIPPFPTRAGSVYQLSSRIDAHGPGSLIRLNDGTQVNGGVRVIKLRPDPDPRKTGSIVVTGGADGFVQQWELVSVEGTRKDGSQKKGVGIRPCWAQDEEFGPNRFKLDCIASQYDPANPCRVVALDCHASKPTEFIAGTSDCDIWEVDKDPRVLIEGQEEDLWKAAMHPDPRKANIFATTCESGKVRIWDANEYNVICAGHAGFPVTGITYSNERYRCSLYNDDKKRNYHIAVGSMGPYKLGDWHKVLIMDADNLQPLKVLKEPCAQVTEIKYSPRQGPGLLAAGSQDMCIYIYNAKKDYQLVCKLTGHSGSIDSLDWTLPVTMPGSRLNGSWLLMASDQSSNLLFWDPQRGVKVTQNQRDAQMASWTSRIGFPVMGIWPEGYSFDDINSVCVSARGRSYIDEDELQGRVSAMPGPNPTMAGADDLGQTISPDKMRALGTYETLARTTMQRGGAPSVDGGADALDDEVDENDPVAIERERRRRDAAAYSVRRARRKESADYVEGCGYIVTADDKSMVHLMNYPAIWENTPYKEYRGHSSHVMCIRFSNDDRRVVSVGGHDRGIYQWRTLGINLEDAEQDNKVMACRSALLIKHRDGEDHVPKPGVEWVPLDEDGRVWGPRGLANTVAAASERGSAPPTPSPGGRQMRSSASFVPETAVATPMRPPPSPRPGTASTPRPEPPMAEKETLYGHWKPASRMS